MSNTKRKSTIPSLHEELWQQIHLEREQQELSVNALATQVHQLAKDDGEQVSITAVRRYLDGTHDTSSKTLAYLLYSLGMRVARS